MAQFAAADHPRARAGLAALTGALQAMAKTILNETESLTLTDLPPLAYN